MSEISGSRDVTHRSKASGAPPRRGRAILWAGLALALVLVLAFRGDIAALAAYGFEQIRNAQLLMWMHRLSMAFGCF